MNTIDIETIYSTQLTQNSNNPLYNENADVDKALDELEFKNNYNNLAFQIGINYRIKFKNLSVQ